MTSTLAEQETGFFPEQYLVAHVVTNETVWVWRPTVVIHEKQVPIQETGQDF